MKRLIYLTLLMTGFFWGCKKNEILVYNTQLTPDLSNPIIQKIVNVPWYRNSSFWVTDVAWASSMNAGSPAAVMSSLLYDKAWSGLTLFSNGSSDMVFRPPFIPDCYIHCKGVWKVSEEEENTVILNTETPVSNVLIKLKVLDMEVQESLGTVKLSADVGNLLANVKFENQLSYDDGKISAGLNHGWIESQEISAAPVRADDFIGIWKTANYEKDEATEKDPLKTISRLTYVKNLLEETPVVSMGMAFDLQKDNKAFIRYPKLLDPMPQGMYATAHWFVKGNKIIVETNEDYALSLGEILFGFPVNTTNLEVLGMYKKIPIRLMKNRFYIIELINKEEKGFWCRITSNDAIIYTYLFSKKGSNEGDQYIRDIIK